MRTRELPSAPRIHSHELEAGVLGLHDDVEQDHGDVEVALQHHAGGGRRADRQDRQRVAVDAQAAERRGG
jgi:hypothetical protein